MCKHAACVCVRLPPWMLQAVAEKRLLKELDDMMAGAP